MKALLNYILVLLFEVIYYGILEVCKNLRFLDRKSAELYTLLRLSVAKQ